MPRLLAIALLSVALAACGGGSSGGGGGGGPAASVAAPVVNGDLPGVGNVMFGTSWDPATLGVTGSTKKVKQGTTPLIAVGRALAPSDPTGVTVQIGQGGSALKARPVDASDKTAGAQLYAVDLSKDNLAPGTWIVTFLSQAKRTLASGYLVVTP